MTSPYDGAREAARLRASAFSAVRAGKLEEAREALLESLTHDPYNATVYLRLAAIARSRREAYQLVDRARRLEPQHPHLERTAVWIHDHVAKRREEPSLDRAEAEGVPQRVSLEELTTAHEVSLTWYLESRLPGRMAELLLDFARWVFSVSVVVVALVFFVALLVDLGRMADFGTLSEVFRDAASFTVDYLRGLAHGDLGVVASGHPSLAGTPVVAELRRAFPLSLGLLATALTLAAVIGLAVGTGAALLRGSRFSGGLLFASVLGISTPSFFAAMLLIWLGVWLYQTTGTHFFPIAGFGWDAHLILPTLVLAARPAAAVTRLSCNALVEVLEADYIRTATAKGLGPRVVLLRHVLRNVGVPLLTTIGVSLRFSLAILPIVEYIFNWPGIGRILLTAVQIHDTVTLVGMMLPLVLLLVLVNLLLEILYPLIDPRLRDSEASAV